MNFFSLTRKKIEFLVPFLIVLVLILYATAARDGHNWGGDFSQYILHAQNLLNKRPYTDLGYVQTDYNPIGPSAYPPGYPIFLVPFLYLFGLNFPILKFVGILFFGLTLLIYWHLARIHLPLSWALGCLMSLAFTPWILKFSNNILSDIPYMASSLLSVYISYQFFKQPATPKGTLFVISAMIFSCSFRTIGIILPVTFFLYALISRGSHLSPAFFVTILLFAVVFILSNSFNCGETYLNSISLNPIDLVRNIPPNLTVYKRGFLRYLALYPSRNEQTLLFLIINNSVLIIYLSLVIFGAIRSLKQNGFQYQELYILCYIALILLYKFTQGTRYLLPIIPLLSIYAFIGFRTTLVALQRKIKSIRKFLFGFNLRPFLPTLVYIPLFFTYWFHYTIQPPTIKANILLDPDVSGLLRTVREQKNLSGVIFSHPRVLRLFSGVRTAICYNTSAVKWNFSRLIKFSSKYELSHLITNPNDKTLRTILSRNQDHFQSIYQNNSFRLYQIIEHPERGILGSSEGNSTSLNRDLSP